MAEATAPSVIQSLAWELPHAEGMAKKEKKRKESITVVSRNWGGVKELFDGYRVSVLQDEKF